MCYNKKFRIDKTMSVTFVPYTEEQELLDHLHQLYELEASIHQLQTMFEDQKELIQSQQESIDSVESRINEATSNTKQAEQQLATASEIKQSITKKYTYVGVVLGSLTGVLALPSVGMVACACIGGLSGMIYSYSSTSEMYS